MISENTSDLSNANLLQEKTQTSCSKAEVLTHIIEGYIIQEGSRPFPVSTFVFTLLEILSHKSYCHRLRGPCISTSFLTLKMKARTK